jgi:FlaA1/EpsC-like NDP-sugar epimerase
VVGIRPGEKIHEEMITESDSFYTWDLGSYYCILPSRTNWNLEEWVEKNSATKVPIGFKYNSGENTEWDTIETLREKIKLHVDANFEL